MPSTPHNNKLKVHIPHLNGLRAILATSVIFFHTEPFKKFMHWKVLPLKTFAICGDVAVTGFFVLSGFLITYLLLQEQNRNIQMNSIRLVSVSKFYLRRIFRIWPLYFFIILVHNFLLPHLHIEDTIQIPDNPFLQNIALHLPLWQVFAYLIFFLPHLLVAMGVLFSPTHVWSIGSEEIFYLFWPWLFRYKYSLKKIILTIIVTYILITYGLFLYVLVHKSTIAFDHPMYIIVRFLYFQRISCMGIGALFAIAFYHHKKILLGSKYAFYIALFILLALLGKGVTLPLFNAEMYALLFGILIYQLSVTKSKYYLLENPVLRYLGDISYGIYMYNPMGVLFSYYITTQYLQLQGWTLSIFYTLFAIIITYMLSSISYKIIEKPFLRLKPS